MHEESFYFPLLDFKRREIKALLSSDSFLRPLPCSVPTDALVVFDSSLTGEKAEATVMGAVEMTGPSSEGLFVLAHSDHGDNSSQTKRQYTFSNK